MVICNCNNVTLTEIKNFLKKYPHATFDELREETTAATNCGRCLDVLQKTYDRIRRDLPQNDQIRITF